MKPAQQKQEQDFSVSDYFWAREQLLNVLFGCVLNIRLRNAGICRKYIQDMDESDMIQYAELVTTINKLRQN